MIILSVSSSPRVSREITARGKRAGKNHTLTSVAVDLSGFQEGDITGDSVQLHTGVVVWQSFRRLVRRREDWS